MFCVLCFLLFLCCPFFRVFCFLFLLLPDDRSFENLLGVRGEGERGVDSVEFSWNFPLEKALCRLLPEQEQREMRADSMGSFALSVFRVFVCFVLLCGVAYVFYSSSSCVFFFAAFCVLFAFCLCFTFICVILLLLRFDSLLRTHIYRPRTTSE